MKHQRHWMACAALLACVSLSLGKAEDLRESLTVHVAPNGSDAHDGTAAEPLASLAGARDVVRQIKTKNPGRRIQVLFADGVYRPHETVVFGLEDSGTEEQVITYAAAPGARPIFTAAMPVSGWKRLDPASPEASGFGEDARRHIWVASLPAGVGRVLSLYDGERLLPRARSGGFHFTDQGEPSLTSFSFPAGALKNWSNLQDIELLVIPQWFWTMNILPLGSVDEALQVGTTTVPCSYLLRRPAKDLPAAVWVEGAPEFLNGPGQWVVNTTTGFLYLWPEGEKPSAQIRIPTLKESIRIEGAIDYEGPRDEPVRHLVFRGLTFMHGARDTFDASTKGWGLQHDWDLFDRGNAMVRLRGAESIIFDQCRFVSGSGGGLRMDLHAKDNRVERCEFGHLGGTGVLLAGYGPGSKDVNRANTITDCEIHHIGELYWHSIGIFVWQSGENLIAHNHIHNTPYSGIVVSGRINFEHPAKDGECSKTVRWHEMNKPPFTLPYPIPRTLWFELEPTLHARKNVVESNKIHHIMEHLHDGNAIYVSGAGRDNQIRRNFIHDIFGAGADAGIRTDDFQYTTQIRDNVLARMSCPGIILKQQNDQINNVLVDCLSPEWGMFAVQLGPVEGSIIERNIFFNTDGKAPPYWEGTTYGMPAYFKETRTDWNLFWSPTNPDWARAQLEKLHAEGVEKNSRIADPRFVDLAKDDFRLKADSPALAMGIESLDVSTSGPRPLPDNPSSGDPAQLSPGGSR